MFSLGREPQGTRPEKKLSPEGRQIFAVSPAAHAAAPICRPLQGLIHQLVSAFLGLTPQANHLSPLRGSHRTILDRFAG